MINDLPTAERVKRGIAPVPESRRLFPRMTVVCTENLKSDYSGDEVVCRGKAQFLRGCKSLPARVAPAGSNRSRRGGNEPSEAFDGKDRLAIPRVCGL
jgi:hypothetical protein